MQFNELVSVNVNVNYDKFPHGSLILIHPTTFYLRRLVNN